MDTDRIEKTAVLKAPRSRVWRAISDSGEFGIWFGVEFAGAFAPGAEMRGHLTALNNAAGRPITIVVERIEPESLFSYRWHPTDTPDDPMTLVEFRLEELAEGTRLTITESGFENVASARRKHAFEDNSEGWGIQIERIARHVGG